MVVLKFRNKAQTSCNIKTNIESLVRPFAVGLIDELIDKVNKCALLRCYFAFHFNLEYGFQTTNDIKETTGANQ